MSCAEGVVLNLMKQPRRQPYLGEGSKPTCQWRGTARRGPARAPAPMPSLRPTLGSICAREPLFSAQGKMRVLAGDTWHLWTISA